MIIELEETVFADRISTPRRRTASRPRKRKKKGVSGRSCRHCGKDPYPNYFYCPMCHHRISLSGGDDMGDFPEPD